MFQQGHVTRGSPFGGPVQWYSTAHFKGDAFPLFKCSRAHYRRHCEPFSGQNALDCRILHIQSHIVFRGDTPAEASAPSAWTQTPISAWLASVHIVPVLRKDHCDTDYSFVWPLRPAPLLATGCVKHKPLIYMSPVSSFVESDWMSVIRDVG